MSLSKGDVVGALEGHKEGESVEAVQFVDLTGVGSDVVVTGGTDGKAFIWDLSTMRLRATVEHEVISKSVSTYFPVLMSYYHDAGRNHFPSSSPASQKPPYHLRVGRQNFTNMGLPYW